jgi:hypothetical protein
MKERRKTKRDKEGRQLEKITAKAQNSGPKLISPTLKFKQETQGYKYIHYHSFIRVGDSPENPM